MFDIYVFMFSLDIQNAINKDYNNSIREYYVHH